MKIANDVSIGAVERERERERESNTFRCEKLGIFVLQSVKNSARKCNKIEIDCMRTHETCMLV